MVGAHQQPEDDVEADPGGRPDAEVRLVLRQPHRREEQGDGGEEEARFLVLEDGEDGDAGDGGVEAE